MKSFLLITILTVLAAACSNGTQANLNNSNPNEDVQNTKMTDTLDQLFLIESEKELAEVFGKENVVFDTVYGKEGEMSMVTILFPESTDQVEILWDDMEQRENMINITQSAYYDEKEDILNTKSRWKTTYGINIGTTLSKLNEINGKAFDFMGFGWDYGGIISDLKEGKLEDLPLMIQLGNIDQAELYNNPNYEALLGDMEYNSDMKEAINLEPVVVLISISNERY